MTGLIFLGAVYLFFIFLAELLIQHLKCSTHTAANVRTLLVTCGVLLLVLELFLRFGTDQYATHRERAKGASYRSINRHTGRSSLNVHKPNIDLKRKRHEFTHSRQTNSLGLSEKEISPEKVNGEYRIITLGDSFTEGIGALYEQTWVKVMERKLSAFIPGRTITTINAGISGSDVVYEYMLLKEILLDYDPDLVVVATNSSDINDIIIRGGMERFQPDGTIRAGHTAPDWEWIYGISYIFRSIVHELLDYNKILIKEKDVPGRKLKAIGNIVATTTLFSKLADDRDFDFLLVVHPSRSTVKRGHHSDRMVTLTAGLKNLLDIEMIDVLEQWQESGVIAAENAESIYWPLDGHHNSEGYRLLGEAVADRIMELNLIR